MRKAMKCLAATLLALAVVLGGCAGTGYSGGGDGGNISGGGE